MRKDVRILLVGDAGVGKTSLILSLVSEEFPEDVPAKAEEITIPADVTPEKVPTHIVDYSSQEQDDNALKNEVLRSHVICIVYAVDNLHSIEQIRTHWMPLLREVTVEEHYRPVILVGNKSDLLDVSGMEAILPIMNDFEEVETCVECSAKTLKNISEVFYYAQKAVLHPTAPLYSPEERELAPKCKQVLTRIFKICDLDNDNLLSDKEIFLFQRRCFSSPLQPDALAEVKSVIKKHIPDGVNDNCITLKGFLYLHTLFIQRGRHETTWTCLRKFGYDDNLQLSKEYLWPHIKVPLGSTTELTNEGYHFFANLFEKYDQDQDGCLSPPELQNLFSTCSLNPWGSDIFNGVITSPQTWISYPGFLAQWTLTTYLNIQKTLEYLAYLGYLYDHGDQLSAIQVTRDKQIDRDKKHTSRIVFHCPVLGAKSVGKTTFLQGLLGRNIKYVATLNKEHIPRYTINTIQLYGQEKYLILQEVDMGRGDTLNALACDIACLMYDVTNPKSFEYCASLFKTYFMDYKVPCLIVAGKADQQEVKQDYELQPVQFCNKYNLPPPQPFSSVHRIPLEVYIKIASMAAYPHLRGFSENTTEMWIRTTIGLAIVAGLGFVIYKTLFSKR